MLAYNRRLLLIDVLRSCEATIIGELEVLDILLIIFSCIEIDDLLLLCVENARMHMMALGRLSWYVRLLKEANICCN